VRLVAVMFISNYRWFGRFGCFFDKLRGFQARPHSQHKARSAMFTIGRSRATFNGQSTILGEV